MNFENVIDATHIFTHRKTAKKIDLVDNLVNNRAFRIYCECIGQIAIDLVRQTEFFDENIIDEMYCYESDEFIDVSMNEPVTTAGRKLADKIIKDCRDGGIKVNIGFIMFCQLLPGKPKTVSLTMRMGSRTA